MRALLASVSVFALAISPANAQTAGLPISKLPQAAFPLAGSELVPLVQDGVTKQAPVSSLPSNGQVTPPSGPSFSPPAIINVSDYGAKCNAQVNANSLTLENPSTVVDDTIALNAAAAAWKAAALVGPATLVFPRNGFQCKTSSPLNFTGTNNSSKDTIVDGLNIFASFSSNGPIGTLNLQTRGIVVPGIGGTPGTYTNVSMTGGAGTGCVASSVVVGARGGVSSIALPTPCGSGYATGDVLSAASGDIGGVTGFSVPVAFVPGTSGTPGTYTNVALNGGNGSGCIASSIVVGSGGFVTTVSLPSGGCGGAINGGGDYAYGDTLTASSASIGGTSGLALTVASTSGRAAIDAMGNRFVHWKDLSITGDCASPSTYPNVGIAIGRVNGDSADNFKFTEPAITGCFRLANEYNNASETNTYIHPEYYNGNQQGGQYELIQDGANHWNWASSFVHVTVAIETAESFNENTFITTDFRGFGSAIWMAGTARHKYIGSYVATFGNAIVLWTDTAIANSTLNADIHVEQVGVNNCFFVEGPISGALLINFSYRDHFSQCSTSLVATDANITVVYAPGLDIDMSNTLTAPVVFSNPSLWIASGYVFVPTVAQWNQPGQWSGEHCIGVTGQILPGSVVCTFDATFGSWAGTSLATNTLTATSEVVGSSVMGNLNTPNITSTGGPITGVTIDNATTSPVNFWSNAALNGSLPTIGFSAPGSGATATLQGVITAGAPAATGGVGCSNGDTFTIDDPQSGGGVYLGGTAGITATGVFGGAVTATSYSYSGSGNGFYWAKPWSASTHLVAVSSTCSVVPTLSNPIWELVNSAGSLRSVVNLGSGGSNYSAGTSLIFTPAYSGTSSGGGNYTISLNATLNIAAGSGSILVNNSGVAFPGLTGSGSTVDCLTAVGLHERGSISAGLVTCP